MRVNVMHEERKGKLGDAVKAIVEARPLSEQLAFLRAAGAGSIAHSVGVTLLDHLIGTRKVVEAWDQPSVIADAALFHSVYGTDVFRPHVVDAVAGRSEVRRLIGEEAERLAYLFGTVDRRGLWAVVDESPCIRDVELERHRRVGVEVVTASELYALVVLHVANEFEQARARDGGPSTCLTRLLASVRLLSTGPRPPWFVSLSVASIAAEETRVVDDYRRGVDLLATDPGAATAMFFTVVRRFDFLAEPFVWLAYLAIAAKQPGTALTCLDRAADNARRFGAPWDKRLTTDEWSALIALLRTHAVGTGDVGDFQLDAVGGPFASVRRVLNRTGVVAGRERFYRFIDAFVDPAANLRKTTYPGLKSQPWYDPREFPITAALEAACKKIQDEFLQIPSEAFHQESESIDRTGSWDVYMFYERGKPSSENLARLPTVLDIFNRFEIVKTYVGLAYISRLAPGTHIAAHRGPTNLRVRCHLPLVVPTGDCAIRVGSETRPWQEGCCLVFDDSFEHEAWNATTDSRIVLIVDLWNPALSFEEIRLITGLQNRMIWQAQNLQRYWENNGRARALADRTWA